MPGDGTGLAEALLGLDGFRVLGVEELVGEGVVVIETTLERVGRSSYGVVAEAQDRLVVEIRDLSYSPGARGHVELVRYGAARPPG
jgi:hypothetical protein